MKSLDWSQATDQELAQIKGVCLDIDDTLSTHGKLTDEAYTALWDLKRKGFAVVPVTGRPAGWCDHIARFWPVDAVIGENGAFVFYMSGGVLKRLNTPGGEPSLSARKKKLEALGAVILKKFPHARWASDQNYREYDLAIDFCEDVPAWPRSDVDQLLALCHAEGANAKLSSIHVNAWYGAFDKRKGFENWLASGAPGISGPIPTDDQWLFIGDSPNDEPLFEKFKWSVGVANLKNYLDRVKHPPRWITTSESGAGFAEMTQALTKGRGHLLVLK